MKKSFHRAVALFSREIDVISFSFSTMRFSIVKISLLGLLVIVGSKSITEAHISLPFLRGGSTAVSAAQASTRQLMDESDKSKSLHPIVLKLVPLKQAINVVGEKIQLDAGKQWDEISATLGREWGKLSSAIVGFFPKKHRSGSKKLDDVIHSFSLVLNANNLDTAQLLKACRAHLALMKSGGAALKLVAKDLESNLEKAEAVFRRHPKKGNNLTSLLEIERESGIHGEGNTLSDPSAAVALLWVRRSLQFQADLYASLIPTAGRHPRDSALGAYTKHLSPYHGWMLQKVFPLSLSQMPDRDVFIAKFGGVEIDELEDDYERKIVKKLRSLVATWEPILFIWRNEFERLDLEDTRRV